MPYPLHPLCVMDNLTCFLRSKVSWGLSSHSNSISFKFMCSPVLCITIMQTAMNLIYLLLSYPVAGLVCENIVFNALCVSVLSEHLT